jgi:hypothetical protein
LTSLAEVKTKICVFGCRRKDNIEKFIIDLPCKCNIYTNICCFIYKEYFNFAGINDFKNVQCICSYIFTFNDLIDIAEQMSALKIYNPKIELTKKINDKYLSTCMLCRNSNVSRKLMFKDEKICKFLNMKDFIHQLCQDCVYNNE